MSSHQLLCTEQDHTKIYLAYAKGRRHSFTTEWHEILLKLRSMSRMSPHPLVESSIPKTAFTSPFGKYEYIKVPFGLIQAPAYFQELMTGILKESPFTITYLDDIIIFSRTAEEYIGNIRQVFEKTTECSLINEAQQMPLLCQRDPVPCPHCQHHKASDYYQQKLEPSTTCTHLKQLNRYMHS